MAFPQTRHSLILRLAKGGDSADWQEFLKDYWGAVCRFAQRKGGLTAEEAEDVSGQTFEALFHNRLLERWSQARSARLRTLICTVVRNILSNRARVQVGREHAVQAHAGQLDRYLAESLDEPGGLSSEETDLFYTAWVDDLIHTAIGRLLDEYSRTDRADYFRVLYGRLCEQMTMPEIAEALQLRLSSAENYYRHARERLGERLRQELLAQVTRYVAPGEVDAEFRDEWSRLGEFLQQHGGIEQALRGLSPEQDPPTGWSSARSAARLLTLVQSRQLTPAGVSREH